MEIYAGVQQTSNYNTEGLGLLHCAALCGAAALMLGLGAWVRLAFRASAAPAAAGTRGLHLWCQQRSGECYCAERRRKAAGLSPVSCRKALANALSDE
jgi:hypothetical protein